MLRGFFIMLAPACLIRTIVVSPYRAFRSVAGDDALGWYLHQPLGSNNY